MMQIHITYKFKMYDKNDRGNLQILFEQRRTL